MQLSRSNFVRKATLPEMSKPMNVEDVFADIVADGRKGCLGCSIVMGSSPA
jgi:hypothetical protein